MSHALLLAGGLLAVAPAQDPAPTTPRAVDLSEVDLTQLDLSGLGLAGVDISQIDLSQLDLSELGLGDIDLSTLDLENLEPIEFELTQEQIEQEEQFFQTCDHNSDGVIVFAEARHSLELDRAGFAVFDIDKSGDLSRDEFAQRYSEVIRRYGGFAPPIPAALAVLPPEQTPQQMMNRWDDDSSRTLDERELQRLLESYSMDGEFNGAAVLEAFDRNGSLLLELGELLPVTALIRQHFTPDWWLPDAPDSEAKDLVGLFGVQVPRPLMPGAVPMPPRMPGPLPHFYRMDLDRDGSISLEDLNALQTPIQVSVRPSTVLNVLDRDQDGMLSPAELRACLD